ncbi:hypothetical protein JTB14_034522 [Gonioctena quinquepunctata]|nr:hypothetical protein JTB14_034522 [Gonioctena quinquepunctata]
MRTASIWPSNFNVFTGADSLPATTTYIHRKRCIETLRDLSTSAVNVLRDTEISEETPEDTLLSTDTPHVHPIPITEIFSVQDNPSVPTNDENLAPPVSIYLNPKPGCS